MLIEGGRSCDFTKRFELCLVLVLFAELFTVNQTFKIISDSKINNTYT